MSVPFPEYEDFDATGLAALVRSGEVRPVELLDAAADRIERLDPVVNAVVSRRFEAARDSLGSVPLDGPFGGVPFLIKDLTPELGEPVTYGSVFFRDYVGEVTPEIVHRFRRAGLVSLGRTNAPEFGLLPTTEPVLNGPTRNPWDLERSTGGSSGGAAAAVAAGMVPMAHASDGGGSIRIPASACGLFGLKPTRGRVPTFPASASDHLSSSLCLSRSVRDTARLLDAVAGAVPGSRFVAPPHEGSFASSVDTDPPPLRVGVVADGFDGAPLHPDCRAAVVETAGLLEGLGHQVTEVAAPVDQQAVAEAFLVVWAAMQHASFLFILEVVAQRPGGSAARRALGDRLSMRALGRYMARSVEDDPFEPFTWRLFEEALRHGPGHALLAEAALQDATYQLAGFFASHDVLLTATLAERPRRLGSFDQSLPLRDFEADLSRYVPFTPVANFAGMPAMSVPLHWTSGGIPIGSHFMAPAGSDGLLLSLAGQLERARPWFGRRPVLSPATAP